MFSSYRPGDLSRLIDPTGNLKPDLYVSAQQPIPAPKKIKENKQTKIEVNDDEEDEEEFEDNPSGESDEEFDSGSDAGADEPPIRSDENSNSAQAEANANSELSPATRRRMLKARLSREDRAEESKSSSELSKSKSTKYSPAADPRTDRTIFIGNLSVSTDKKAVINLLKPFGSVESLRFRSFSKENPKMPNKAVFIQRKFHAEKDSLNAYAIMKSAEEAIKATKLNGTEFNGKILRVDRAESSGKTDPGRSVFIGNLPFNAREDELRKLFADCGKIENVRIVRDKESSMGKGFAYVEFAESKSVKLGVALHGIDFSGRRIRISKVAKPAEIAKQKADKLKLENKGKPGENTETQRKAKVKHAKRKAAAAEAEQENSGATNTHKRAKVESSNSFEGERASERSFQKETKRAEEAKSKKKSEKKSASKKSLIKGGDGKRKQKKDKKKNEEK